MKYLIIFAMFLMACDNNETRPAPFGDEMTYSGVAYLQGNIPASLNLFYGGPDFDPPFYSNGQSVYWGYFTYGAVKDSLIVTLHGQAEAEGTVWNNGDSAKFSAVLKDTLIGEYTLHNQIRSFVLVKR